MSRTAEGWAAATSTASKNAVPETPEAGRGEMNRASASWVVPTPPPGGLTTAGPTRTAAPRCHSTFRPAAMTTALDGLGFSAVAGALSDCTTAPVDSTKSLDGP